MAQTSSDFVEQPRVVHPASCRTVFRAHGLINLLAQNAHVTRSGDPDPDVGTADFEHGHDNIITDGDAVARAASQDEHSQLAEKIEQRRLQHSRRRLQRRLEGVLEAGKIGVDLQDIRILDL